MGKAGRNYGIDVLRVLATCMIVLLHLNFGQILEGVKPLSGHWFVAHGIEQICIIGVNVFALISGFVNYGKKYKITNIISLWLQIFFYSFFITLVFYFWKRPDVSTATLISFAFPVTMYKYWYVSAYFFLFFLMPALNLVMQKSPRKLTAIFITIVMFNCTIIGYVKNAFVVNNGFSVIWLAALYMIGAFVKKYDWNIKIKGKAVKPYVYLLLFFLCTIIGLLSTVISTWRFSAGGRYKYIFPLNVLSSITLFLFFAKSKIKGSKFLVLLSSFSFAVYLIGSHSLFTQYFITGKFLRFLDWHPLALLGIMLGFVVALYAICSVVEWVRQKMMQLFGVNKGLKCLQRKCDKLYEKLLNEDTVTTDEEKS